MKDTEEYEIARNTFGKRLFLVVHFYTVVLNTNEHWVVYCNVLSCLIVGQTLIVFGFLDHLKQFT
jgi:hypothetical protein